MAPCVFDGSLLGVAHPMLDLGKDLLDRLRSGEYGDRNHSTPWKIPSIRASNGLSIFVEFDNGIDVRIYVRASRASRANPRASLCPR